MNPFLDDQNLWQKYIQFLHIHRLATEDKISEVMFCRKMNTNPYGISVINW